jgi:hypothetical protein
MSTDYHDTPCVDLIALLGFATKYLSAAALLSASSTPSLGLLDSKERREAARLS